MTTATANNNATVNELKEQAKALNIKGFSKMKKADLISAIKFFTDEERKANEAVVSPWEEQAPDVSPWDKYLSNKEFIKCFNETYKKSYTFSKAYNGKACRTLETMEYVCRQTWRTVLKSSITKDACIAFLNYLVKKGVFSKTHYSVVLRHPGTPKVYTLFYVK